MNISKNRIFLSVFFLTSFFLFPNFVFAASQPDNLDLAIFHFDEPTGVIANDASLNGYDLKWAYNPWSEGKIIPTRVPGKWDLGINFNQAEETYIFKDSHSINLDQGLTIGMWIKTNNNSNDKTRFLWLGNWQDSRIEDPSNFILLSTQNGKVYLDLKQKLDPSKPSDWQQSIVSRNQINDNTWHFITATLNPINLKMSLFIDGQSQGEASFNLPIPTMDYISLGRREYYFDPYAYNFQGTIDDLWLRSEPLTPDKITEIYDSNQPYKQDNITPPRVEPTVFANYSFDNLNLVSAPDLSGNNHTFTWGNNPYSPGSSPLPRSVPGKFGQGVSFRKLWEAYQQNFDSNPSFPNGASFNMWIKTAEVSSPGARFFWIGNRQENISTSYLVNNYLTLKEEDGKIQANLDYFDGYHPDSRHYYTRNYNLSSDQFVSDDVWHFISVTFDSRPNVHTMKLYIDGELKDTKFFPRIFPFAQKSSLGYHELGVEGNITYNFNGDMDDVTIMSSVLTDDDVKNIYQSNQPFSWPVQKKRNPVIIVPGIMGSSLNYGDVSWVNEIWPNAFEYATDPLDNTLKELKMDSYGKSIYDIELIDIVRDVSGVDFYGSLIEYLKSKGYEEGKDLFVFPYDWRNDINISSGYNGEMSGVITLKDKIDKVKKDTRMDKVDIIAHSLGGLVTKSYVKKYGQDSINKFIDIATPHLGSPETGKILNFGSNLGFKKLGIYLINSDRIKEISQNMLSIYQLLPSQSYFNLPGNEYSSYIYNDGTVSNTAKGNLDYIQSLDYLNKTGDEGRSYFTNTNTLLHAAIDNVKINNSYNIVGCGMPTIGKIDVLGSKKFFWTKNKLEYIDGDGTVPLRSADYFGAKKYYVKGKEHSELPGTDVVKEFIGAILKGQENSFNYSSHSNFSQSDNICGVSGKVVEFHCPVQMHVYDQNGNHVGPKDNGDIEMNIPGVHYDIVDGNKFVFLPDDANQYTIVGNAEEAGALEVEISEVKNNQYGKAIYFNNINLESKTTKIEFGLENNLDNQSIKVDEDGNGVFEKTATIDSVLDENTRNDLTKPTTKINLSGIIGNNNYYVSDVQVELSAQDDNSGVLKTEYSLDNGQTWNNYQTPFNISEDGEHKIIYTSIDRAGNREVEQNVIIEIDKIKPEVLILIPEKINHDQMLNIQYLATDNFSGIATDTTKFYLDNNQISTSTVDLFYQKIGNHKIRISIEDNAGNINTEETNFEIITNIDSTILDVDRSKNENMINQKAKDELTRDLNSIKKYIDRFGKREERRDIREVDLIKKCSAHKNSKWCKDKFGKIFTHIDYRLDWIYGKVIKLQYSLILKDLELYYRKNWVTKTSYDIIKDDLNYLISKI